MLCFCCISKANKTVCHKNRWFWNHVHSNRNPRVKTQRKLETKKKFLPLKLCYKTNKFFEKFLFRSNYALRNYLLMFFSKKETYLKLFWVLCISHSNFGNIKFFNINIYKKLVFKLEKRTHNTNTRVNNICYFLL